MVADATNVERQSSIEQSAVEHSLNFLQPEASITFYRKAIGEIWRLYMNTFQNLHGIFLCTQTT